MTSDVLLQVHYLCTGTQKFSLVWIPTLFHYFKQWSHLRVNLDLNRSLTTIRSFENICYDPRHCGLNDALRHYDLSDLSRTAVRSKLKRHWSQLEQLLKDSRITVITSALQDCGLSEWHSRPGQLTIIIIITTTMFTVLLSCPRSLSEFTQFIWWMQSSAKRPPTLRRSHLTWAVSPPVLCSYHLQPPSPFIIITQLKSWYSFTVPWRVEGWVDLGTAGKVHTARAQGCKSQWFLR